MKDKNRNIQKKIWRKQNGSAIVKYRRGRTGD